MYVFEKHFNIDVKDKIKMFKALYKKATDGKLTPADYTTDEELDEGIEDSLGELDIEEAAETLKKAKFSYCLYEFPVDDSPFSFIRIYTSKGNLKCYMNNGFYEVEIADGENFSEYKFNEAEKAALQERADNGEDLMDYTEFKGEDDYKKRIGKLADEWFCDLAYEKKNLPYDIIAGQMG